MPRKRVPDPYAPCILVVDDETQVRRLFERMLEEAGYFVAGAASGREALTIASDRYYEIAIIDLSLPDMDGFDVVQALRAAEPGIKTVVMSGFSQRSLLETAGRMGVAAVLQKPLEAETLLSTVCDVLAASSGAGGFS